MAGVVDGQDVSAAVTNPAFIIKNADDGTVYKLFLRDPAPVSGPILYDNTQRALNTLDTTTGATETVPATAYAGVPASTITPATSHEQALIDLANKFSGTASPGHIHNGTDGEGPNITASDLVSVPLKGYIIQGVDQTGVTGTSTDVSTDMAGKFNSTGSTVLGVVVTAPNNKLVIRQASGTDTDDSFKDALGNIVYGRLTFLASVWTLSYYVELAGVETAYSFASPSDVRWYYQELFNPMSGPPVYSEFATIPSDNATADVIDASATARGVVNTGPQTFAGQKDFQDGVQLETAWDTPKTDVASATTIAALSYAPFIRVTGSTATTIQGIASGVDGRRIVIHNGCTQQVIISNEDAGASAANRLHLPNGTNITIRSNSSAEFIYNSGLSRWVVKSGAGTGSGSGGSGVNMIGLDSNFQAVNPDDIDAEGTVGNWAAYANTPGVDPVDMTGGSPTVAISRTTTSNEVLDGLASFKVIKDAADRQGEGVSLLVNIPIGYRGKRHNLFLPWKILSGGIISGDIKCFFYDVTNSNLLNPGGFDVTNFYYQINCFVDIPASCDQIRVGFHFASASATAVTFSFDDNFLGLGKELVGPNISDWQSYTPVFTGAGTVSNVSAAFRRVGDTLEINVATTTGTPDGTAATCSLPAGYQIDGLKIGNPQSPNYALVGYFDGEINDLGSYTVLAFGDNAFVNFGTHNNSLFGITPQPGTSIFPTSADISFFAKVPIKGWSANVATVPSGVLRASDLMANGARVTGSPPTQIGEYRSYLRANGTHTFSETNGTPTIVPSIADGIAIYFNNAGDNNNEPSKYDIFVGKNSLVKIQFYSSSGRTGFINVDSLTDQGGTNYGYSYFYDPTTGIFTILKFTGGNTTNLATGYDDVGNSISTSPIYFDLSIAHNDFQIQLYSDLGKPVYVKEIQTSGTDGGTFTAGAWQTRNLNAVENILSWLSLAANQITLDAGIYSIEGSAEAYNVQKHKLRLYNITDSATVIIGTSADTNVAAQTPALLMGTFTITSQKVFEVQHRCISTEALDGFGINSGFGIDEVYSQFKIVKLS